MESLSPENELAAEFIRAFTEKHWYRTRTETYANTIRIFNFFVNAFGEWQCGSAETIRRPDISSN